MPARHYSPHHAFQILLILGMILAGALVFHALPERVPMHWNLEGMPTSWMDKTWAVALLPGLAIILSLLFPLLVSIDPFAKQSSQLTKSWERISLLLIAFFAFAYGQQMTASLRPDMAILCGKAIIGALGFLFVCLGALMRDLPRNSFAGIRTPWTLSNDVTWKKTHTFSSVIWILAGLVVIAESLVWSAHPLAVLLTATIGAVIASIVASFVFRQKHAKH